MLISSILIKLEHAKKWLLGCKNGCGPLAMSLIVPFTSLYSSDACIVYQRRKNLADTAIHSLVTPASPDDPGTTKPITSNQHVSVWIQQRRLPERKSTPV